MINGTDKISIVYDVYHIIFNTTHLKLIIEDEWTFNDVLEYARQNGYEEGVLYFIADSPLYGEGWTYGNYMGEWHEYCKTRGYV